MFHGNTAMFDELFRRSGLNLDRLRRFVEAASYSSYAEAADATGSDPSQFSRDIAQLESFFECKLVRKEGRQISGLTSQGERLRHLVTEYFNALIAMQDEFKEPPPLITIGAGETVLQWVICARLEALKAAFPGSRLKLSNHNSQKIIKMVEEGSLDVGIVDTRSLAKGGDFPSHFAILSLGQIEYALYLTESLMEQHRSKAERELLETLPLAGLEGLPPLATAHQIEQALDGFQLNFAVILTSFPQVIQAVRTGALAGFLPTLAEEELSEHGIIKVDSSLLQTLQVEISLIYNTRLQGAKPYLAAVGGEVHAILNPQSSDDADS